MLRPIGKSGQLVFGLSLTGSIGGGAGNTERCAAPALCREITCLEVFK